MFRFIRKRLYAIYVFACVTATSLLACDNALALGTAPPVPAFDKLMKWAQWGGATAAVVGFLGAGAGLALAHHRQTHAHDHVSKLGWVGAGGAVIGSAGTLARALTG